MRNYLLLILLVGFFISCSSDEEVSVEVFDYSVAIMSPDNTDKAVGESVHLHINFDETKDLIIHNISVLIRDESGHEIYSHTEHVHTASHYEHHDDIVLDVAAGTELTMEASAWPLHSTEDEQGHGEGEGEHEGENEGHEEETEIDGKVKATLTFTVR